jgi:hypothetical protein
MSVTANVFIINQLRTFVTMTSLIGLLLRLGYMLSNGPEIMLAGSLTMPQAREPASRLGYGLAITSLYPKPCSGTS